MVGDFSLDKSANEIFSNYNTSGRHKYCGIFYLFQQYNDVHKLICSNVNFVISFIQAKKYHVLYYIISPFMERDDFISLSNNLWRERYTIITGNTRDGRNFKGKQ